jgi:uncharacterized tellurite resistance protein B-like protein/GTPase SAR1 family protein
MDISVISPQTVELISRLTGQKLHQQDITPPVLFLTALITVLLGVIHADDIVSDEETQRLRNLLELIPANHSFRQLVMPIVNGVEEQQIYKKIQVFLALTACFSEEEKLLLISFGYQMSAADGTMDDRETGYLALIGNRLEIDSRYLAVLSASFNNQTISDTAALAEVHSLLDPAQFQSLDSLFVRAASHIIEDLPAKPKYSNPKLFVNFLIPPVNKGRVAEWGKKLTTHLEFLYKKNQLDSVQIIADLPAELKQEKNQLDSVQIIEDLPTELEQEINQLDSIQIIEDLPTEFEQEINQNHSVSSYKELQNFQQYRQKLNAVCQTLSSILRDGSDRNVLSPTLTAEVTKESRNLQSQRFRVAVVGEFSKGKSTLLNALLGEEIQPVRDIPCSGTVTVLKYGPQQRVICKYKDGREEEISPQQYKDKAAISEEAALGDVGDELINSELQEIIFEHPNLELCCNGVEIIDTPGLNEHAERTLVTEQVLKTTDAVIFLTHAQNVLTEKERELLLYLKQELNPERDDEAARNIFILVNFADLLRREGSHKQARQRVETIVKNQNLIAGENRIHLISAQSALDAILDGTENEYVQSFQDFTKSLEQFLIEKRGAIALQESAAGLKQIINTGCEELNQYQKMLDGKLTLPEADKQKIFEQMAEVSGRDVKIRLLAKKIRQECLEESHESWNEWLKELRERIISKSANWNSKHSHLWSQDQLITDYANQFVRELTQDINFWTNHKLSEIVKQKIGVLDDQIYDNLEPICEEFELFDLRLNTNLFTQFKDFATSGNRGGIRITGIGIAASISTIGVDVGGFVGGTLGIGAAVGAALFFLTGVGTIPVILGALAAAAGGGLGWSQLDGDVVKAQIKEKVCELGFQEFEESSQSIFIKNIQKKIIAVFEKRTEATSDVMSKAIALWENLLEQQEKHDRQNQAECEAQKVWLAEKRRELQQIESQIEAVLNQSDRT